MLTIAHRPAFWAVGPNWPNQGEIDIIEGVNDQSNNDMTLHTGPGCSISSGGGNNAAYTGSLTSTSCVSGAGNNQGCQIQDTSSNSYGSAFNSNGGGVYAMDWTSSGIDMYFFPRGSVPNDVLSSSPDPATWGAPVAAFAGSACDFSTSFTNQQLVFDTTFCGDWAGQVWAGSTCASQTGAATCEDFVANNPGAFKEAYWSINALKVYQSNGGAASPSQPAASSPPQSSAPNTWGQPSAAPTSWGAPVPSAAPSAPAPSAAPSAPSAGGQSSFVTVPSGAPASSPSAPGWAPIVTNSGQVVSAPVPAPTSAPAAAPSAQASSPGQWHPSHTWSGNQPWQSGGWTEYQNSDGSFAVGVPVHQRRHRHLRHHRLHAAGRKL